MKSRSAGFSLAELLVVLAIVATIVCVSIPSMQTMRRRDAVRAAARRMETVIRFVRSRAIVRHANSAVKFRHDPDGWVWLVYDDGDGDGVRNNDIRRGVDPLVRGPEVLLDPDGPVAIALPPFPIRDPDSSRRLGPKAKAVRFNRSSLCSFSPIGGGTSGSVFMTDGSEMVAAIRVLGTSGRVRIQWLDVRTGRWSNR